MTPFPTAGEQQRTGRLIRWALAVGLVVWLALSVVGGLVQYAAQGWTVPVGQWRFSDGASTYWLYPWSKHWALAVVPVSLAKALPASALAGLYTGLVVARRAKGRCCVPWRRGSGPLAVVGLAAGAGGMLACCSPIALAVAGLVGFGAVAFFTDHGLWMGTLGLAAAVAWQAHALARGRRQTAVATSKPRG